MATTSSVSTIPVTNPINNEELYKIEEADDQRIEEVYDKARKIKKNIRKLSIEERIAEVDKISDYVVEHREEIIDRIVEETGKTRLDAFVTEVFEVCDLIEYFRKAAPKALQDKKVPTPIVLMGKKSKITYQPLGVIQVIAPWNFPFFQALGPSILAFLSGNAVVVKSSEYTPLQGVLEDVLEGSGFMKDAIQVVYGAKETGRKLVDQRPDKVHFTGSVKSGRKVMEQAAQFPIPVDLELGGKDAAIVFEDVNIEKTANGIIWGAFNHSGQSCTSIERLYIHDSIFNELLEAIVNLTQQLRWSSPERNYKANEDCDIGCMTTEFQVQIFEEHIRDAIEKGARVLTGGEREEGSLHFPPTILADVDHTMKVITEESFGPILPVMKFSSEEEAIDLANDSIYGLGGSVWSKDLQRAERVAKSMETGSLSINNHMLNEANPALPFGGTKNSGFGRYRGDEGLHTFCNTKAMIIDKQNKVLEPQWYPSTASKYEILTEFTKAFFKRPKNWLKVAKIGMKLDTIGSKEKYKVDK